MNHKKGLRLILLTLSVFSLHSYSQQIENFNDCDPDTQNCTEVGRIVSPDKNIYPHKPFSTEHMESRLQALHEGTEYIDNIFVMNKKRLNYANTKVQPWGGPYWQLYQGMIANPYHRKDYKTFIFTLGSNLHWKRNFNKFQKRKRKVYPEIYNLPESELAKLAPSEKYDLLLGDTSFDLTNRIWNYVEKWGTQKKWAFLSSIDIPQGYVIPSVSSLIAFWEGICHGWAVASGHYPRPQKTVYVTLPNGKKMPFYPNDIKALISLMWANSVIQSDVIFEGNRCNRKYPDKDAFGRYIDVKKDKNDDQLLPRCADVHPGIFHISMVNILGVEGRSFIVDKTAEAPVSNQPVSGYTIKYFNPESGRHGPLKRSVVSRKSLGDADPFKDSRHPDATQIVGVEVSLRYIDWEFPKKATTNSIRDDKVSSFEFTYDLELNAQGKIVGGQWRVKRKLRRGRRSVLAAKTHQPDFFWVVPRNWKNYFRPLSSLPEWNFEQSSLPPKEFLPAAIGAHSFVYEQSARYSGGVSPQCRVLPENGGEALKVDCEFRTPRPQPLINVVEKLVEQSRK